MTTSSSITSTLGSASSSLSTVGLDMLPSLPSATALGALSAPTPAPAIIEINHAPAAGPLAPLAKKASDCGSQGLFLMGILEALMGGPNSSSQIVQKIKVLVNADKDDASMGRKVLAVALRCLALLFLLPSYAVLWVVDGVKAVVDDYATSSREKAALAAEEIAYAEKNMGVTEAEFQRIAKQLCNSREINQVIATAKKLSEGKAKVAQLQAEADSLSKAISLETQQIRDPAQLVDLYREIKKTIANELKGLQIDLRLKQPGASELHDLAQFVLYGSPTPVILFSGVLSKEGIQQLADNVVNHCLRKATLASLQAKRKKTFKDPYCFLKNVALEIERIMRRLRSLKGPHTLKNITKEGDLRDPSSLITDNGYSLAERLIRDVRVFAQDGSGIQDLCHALNNTLQDVHPDSRKVIRQALGAACHDQIPKLGRLLKQKTLKLIQEEYLVHSDRGVPQPSPVEELEEGLKALGLIDESLVPDEMRLLQAKRELLLGIEQDLASLIQMAKQNITDWNKLTEVVQDSRIPFVAAAQESGQRKEKPVALEVELLLETRGRLTAQIEKRQKEFDSLQEELRGKKIHVENLSSELGAANNSNKTPRIIELEGSLDNLESELAFARHGVDKAVRDVESGLKAQQAAADKRNREAAAARAARADSAMSLPQQVSLQNANAQALARTSREQAQRNGSAAVSITTPSPGINQHRAVRPSNSTPPPPIASRATKPALLNRPQAQAVALPSSLATPNRVARSVLPALPAVAPAKSRRAPFAGVLGAGEKPSLAAREKLIAILSMVTQQKQQLEQLNDWIARELAVQSSGN